jgi:hypothetical protein
MIPATVREMRAQIIYATKTNCVGPIDAAELMIMISFHSNDKAVSLERFTMIIIVHETVFKVGRI